MELQDVRSETDGPVAIVTLDRPRYRNAQSWRMLDELDVASHYSDMSFSYHCEESGLQFGLFNWISDGWIPLMVGINLKW